MAAGDLTELDPVARFDLIASAIAEKPIAVRPGAEALPTHTDGHTIWINDVEVQQDRDRIREAVVIQALLIRHGGLVEAASRRLRRPSVAHRYFGFEIRRALALGSPVPLVALVAGSPGARAAVSTSAEESLDWARGRLAADPTPPHWGTLIPASVRHDPPTVANTGATPEKERTDMFTLVTRRIRKGTNGRRKGDGSGTMIDGWSSGAGARLGAAVGAPAAPSASYRSRDGATLHPEWDVRRGAYRADWCSVREKLVPQRQNGSVNHTLPDPQLRRGIARLARSLDRVRGQHEGDDVDLDAVIDRQVSRRAGHHWDRGVHVARLRIKPELTVMILMDASSSTAQPLRGGSTVFDEQRTCASSLIDAMTSVGLSTAWWTFRSQGRRAVSIEQVKPFDQPADYDMHARAAAVEPGGFTRLGAAIRHAAMPPWQWTRAQAAGTDYSWCCPTASRSTTVTKATTPTAMHAWR